MSDNNYSPPKLYVLSALDEEEIKECCKKDRDLLIVDILNKTAYRSRKMINKLREEGK